MVNRAEVATYVAMWVVVYYSQISSDNESVYSPELFAYSSHLGCLI
jgi:hypothetical protein